MPRTHLSAVFRAIILAKITNALPACRGFLPLSKLDGSNPFLSEHLNLVFAPSFSHFWIWLMMLTKHSLAVCIKNSIVSQVILPEVKTTSVRLRQKSHVFDVPRCTLEIHKRSFFHSVCLNSFNCF